MRGAILTINNAWTVVSRLGGEYVRISEEILLLPNTINSDGRLTGTFIVQPKQYTRDSHRCFDLRLGDLFQLQSLHRLGSKSYNRSSEVEAASYDVIQIDHAHSLLTFTYSKTVNSKTPAHSIWKTIDNQTTNPGMVYMLSQIAKTLGLTSIRPRSHTFVSDRPR